MSGKQVKNFNINNMGRKAGMCLQNVRLGFGIPAKHASAKVDMEANRRDGTLHDIATLPTNVAVPVYLDTASPYEHVIVADHGTFYSDGKRLSSLNGLKVYGWGEKVNDVRVVEWVNDPAKSNEEIATEVIAGKWGNGDDRRNRLRAAGYDYNAIQAIVNNRASGGSKSIDQIAREVIAGMWGNGAERKRRISAAGYDYAAVQARVNQLMR